MKAFTFFLIVLVGTFVAGCCNLVPQPVAGKVRPVFVVDGPESATNHTGSIICTFGTAAHPRTKWWLDSANPPQNPGAVHLVSPSLDDIVTGILAGRHVMHFSTSFPATAPCATPIDVYADKTRILSVDYRVPLQRR